jgi:hypothetical protein
MGIRNFQSNDITTAAGDWLGGAYVPGAVAWCTASTAPIRPENPARAAYVPGYGLLIEEKATSESGISKAVANCFSGVDTLDPTLFPQFRLVSIND